MPKKSPRAQLKAFLAEHAGDSGIVYCLSRARVDEIAAWLARQGYAALPYHAGLDKDRRARHQDRFLKEDGIVMVATIAFGMGIDKRSEEHTSELQSLMRISYAVFCLKKKN